MKLWYRFEELMKKLAGQELSQGEAAAAIAEIDRAWCAVEGHTAEQEAMMRLIDAVELATSTGLPEVTVTESLAERAWLRFSYSEPGLAQALDVERLEPLIGAWRSTGGRPQRNASAARSSKWGKARALLRSIGLQPPTAQSLKSQWLRWKRTKTSDSEK